MVRLLRDSHILSFKCAYSHCRSTDESIRSETEDVIKRVAAGPVHTYKKDLIKAGLITTLVQLLDDVELQDSAASLATYVAPHVSLQALENGACPTLVSLLR
jgi:hypothetical protein